MSERTPAEVEAFLERAMVEGARLVEEPGDLHSASGFFSRVDQLLFNLLLRKEELFLGSGGVAPVLAEVRALESVIDRYADYREPLRQRIIASSAGPERERRLKRLHAAVSPERLIVLVTRRCQLRCTYCDIPDYSGDLAESGLERALSFLMTSARDRVHLQFFGGEPLIRYDLIQKAVALAKPMADRAGKQISFMLTTNGLLLTADKLDFFKQNDFLVEVSCDGAMETQLEHRALGKKNYYPELLQKLEEVKASGNRYYLVMTVLPGTVDRLFDNFTHLAGMGHRRIQVNYALGVHWAPENITAFFRQFERILDHVDKNPGAELINATESRREPVALNGELTIDRDGSLFLEPGIFLNLRDGLGRGEIVEATMDSRGATQFDTFWALSKAYARRRPELRPILVNNIHFGRAVERMLKARRARA